VLLIGLVDVVEVGHRDRVADRQRSCECDGEVNEAEYENDEEEYEFASGEEECTSCAA
jgi:hypothetical protein